MLDTNGDAEAGTASWTFDAGQGRRRERGRSRYADPNAPSPVSWTLFTATLVALAGGAVVLFARRTRNPPVRPPR